MYDKQIELIIQRACAETFSDSEKYIVDDFLQETGRGNPVNWTVIDADRFISRLDGADVSNEFLSGAITRLAQVAPAHIVSRVLGSDRDGDGIPLYEELKLAKLSNPYLTNCNPVNLNCLTSFNLVKSAQAKTPDLKIPA